jgi:hypothetical protein
VTELVAASGAPVKVIRGAGYGFSAPDSVASDGTHVWVTSGVADTVTELLASTGALVQVL